MNESIRITQTSDTVHPDLAAPVSLKCMGNIYEIRFMTRDIENKISKLNKDEYVLRETGEVKPFQHGQSRCSNLTTVAQSMRELRDLINTNITDPDKCLWITLTYKENMKDVRRLYNDFRKFIMRFRTYQKHNKFPDFEYIVAMEPQGRGAFHAHLILIFAEKAPFIPNEDIQGIWKQGFTKTKPLHNVDNVGLYLTAYLTDMDLVESLKCGNKVRGKMKVVDAPDERGKKASKAIIKGARLSLYPLGFRLFRVSRGIKRPEVKQCTEAEAMKEIGDAPLTYQKTICVGSSDGKSYNTINYRQYNKARKASLEGAAKADGRE
jgi:hypothetical protein